MPERKEELFITPEEEAKEKGPIFYFEREGKLFVSVTGVDLEVYQGEEGEITPQELEDKTPEEKAGILRQKAEFGTQYKSKEFENFILDEKSLEILTIFAQAAKLNQPCLMEGRHDIGKTKALEYLAYLTNHHLIHQSCSGQTDVLEWMGKYVPATESGQIRLRQLLERKGELKPETRELLEKLKTEGRTTLTLGESKRIAELEGILSPEEIDKQQWVFEEGTIGRAIHYAKGKGCWLYFDELGAVEPNIYIKLNPLLSDVVGARRITVTENAAAPTLEAGPEFRLFATTNPPELYQARESFARDYLSRWLYHKIGPLDEEAFRGRVLAGLTGEKPQLPPEFYRPPEEPQVKFGPEQDETDREILRVLFGELYVRFHQTAKQFLETYPWASREQQFDFDDNRDRERLVEYFRNFQGGDPLKSLKEAIEYCYLGKIDPDKIVEEAGVQLNFRQKLSKLFDDLAGSGPIGLKTQEKIERILEARKPELRKQKVASQIAETLQGIDSLPQDLQTIFREGAERLKENL